MNMISTGAFLSEMDASSKQLSSAEKFAAVWEKKNAKAARAGGVSLMALSLAACGSSSSTTSTSSTDTTTTTTTTAATSLAFTTGVDSLTGGAGDDTFTGVNDATNANDTLQVYDTVAGGAGTDTLHVINSDNEVYSPINASGIEVFKYQATDDAGDLDVDDIHGATTLNLYRANNDIDVNDLTQAVTFKIEDLQSAYDGTITYKASDVDNAADAATVELAGADTGSVLTFDGDVESMTLNVTAESTFTDLVLDANTTSVTINASADLNAVTDFNANGATTLTLTGSGDIDLTGSTDVDLAALTTIAAGDATGAISLLINDAKNQTITTGSGDDTLDMDGTLTAADTIDLGAGDDTLRVDIDGLTAAAGDLSVSNVETLRFDALTGASGAIQMDNLSVSKIRFDQHTSNVASNVITLTDLGTGITAFEFTGLGEANDDVFFNGLTIDYDSTTDVAAATFTVSNAGTTADDMRIGKVDADTLDKLTITATDIGQAADDELTFDEIESDNITDLVVSADGELLMSLLDLAAADDISFADADGGVTITDIEDLAAAATIEMGDGADTVTISENASANTITIDLGAGNDVFTGTDETNTITTGAGIDRIVFQGDAADDVNIITDFTAGAGGDIIDFVSNGANDGGTTLTNVESITVGTTDKAEAGVVIIDNGSSTIANADALTAAGIADRLGDLRDDAGTTADAVTFEGDGDDFYVVISDGTDTAIALVADSTGDSSSVDIATADVTVLVTLQGISDAGTITADNFYDFLA